MAFYDTLFFNVFIVMSLFPLLNHSRVVFLWLVSCLPFQAEQLLGITADEMDQLRKSDEERYQLKLKEAQWGQWVVGVQSRAREYNGEVRMRYSGVQVWAMDWSAECQRLKGLIDQM